MKSTPILSQELQLKQALNRSIQDARRADFALMLAMLDQDVRNHSQFHLPHEKITEKTVNTEVLRKRFQLPEPAPIAAKQGQISPSLNQAAIAQGDLASVRLRHALSPQPLNIRDDKNYIDDEIINNCDLHVQQRYRQKNNQLDTLGEFNAELWLNNIADMRAKVAA